MRQLIKTLPYLLVSFLVISCGKDSGSPSSLSTEAATESIIEAEIKDLSLYFKDVQKPHSWKPVYSKSILRYLETKPELSILLDSDLSSSDLSRLGCEGYKSAGLNEKRRFWVTFMASIAHVESGLNPETTYREKDGTLSSGLLQIDVASANRHASSYTGRRFNQADVINPDLNLMAGLYVMKHQLEGGINGERSDIKNRLFTNANYYWSVLTRRQEKIIETFKRNAKTNLPFCSVM